MKIQCTLPCIAIVWTICSVGGIVRAQQAPDTILYNGKVVTVDNHEVNSELGTIAQALAVKGNAIVAVGSNTEVRKLAGANTKSIDLKGRTVLPGFAATHDHPQDWDPLNPYIVRKLITDDMHIERFMWEDSPDQKIQQFPRVLDEAVHKAKPGQWIRINLLFGKEYRDGGKVIASLGRQLTKQMLDMMAPNNPVIVRAGFVGTLINQKAVDVVKEHYGDQWDKFINKPLQNYGGGASAEENGVCSVCYREVEQDVLFSPEILREMYRLGLSWMAGYGVTTTATSLYTGGAIRAYKSLDRAGQMAIRLSWGWFWPERNDFFQDPYFVNAIAAQEGRGSDYYWFSGMTPHQGGNCSKLPGTSPEVKNREDKCGFANPVIARALYEYVKAGGRLTGDHMMGDGEIDLALDIIEKASKDAGMTPEEIASKRHVTEHMAMYPRQDQLPRYKKLGMMTSGWNLYIWEKSGDQILKDYGERGVEQMVPRKSLYAAGIMNSVEIDRPIGYTNLTYFTDLYAGITRKDQDGKIMGANQAIDRQAMLKSTTLWGAYGVKHEKQIGSLELGKWADLVVLDKDYLTVPVDDILKIRVLMTMVGGKVVHLVPSLAKEIGMQPTGAQVELGGPAAQW